MAAEVHVGDIGTTYRVAITDRGVPFDPSAAEVRELVFGMPQGVLTKPATAEQNGAAWFLVYVVDDPVFHAKPGPFTIQAHVKFSASDEYRSEIQRYDADGVTLQVWANLVTP